MKHLLIVEEDLLPGCSLRYVENKERLNRKNIQLVDIKCSNVTESSEHCRPRDSHIIYKCRNGFKFNSNLPNQGICSFWFTF